MSDIELIKYKLRQSLLIIEEYNWLINSYVLDFYIDNHWSRLPKSWTNLLQNFNPILLAELLSTNVDVPSDCKRVLPLSFICLKKLLKTFCIPRKFTNSTSNMTTVESCQNLCIDQPNKLQNIFSKHIKPKKRHEIKEIGNICAKTAEQCDTTIIVDFGAGLGHLARHLAYRQALKVCCIEQQAELNRQADLIDNEFEFRVKKYLDNNEINSFNRPKHLNLKLTKDVDKVQFVDSVKQVMGIQAADKIKFGIVGLHPCADLSIILMKLFHDCEEAKFINVVGCCYMKLSTELDSNNFRGFPVSDYLNNNFLNLKLSYEAREIACHAIEVYIKRLKDNDYEYLKIHSYRAALEEIIVHCWPNLKHCGLRSVKHTEGLSFEDYCQRALHNTEIAISLELCKSNKVLEKLKFWKNVVIFYSLRLMFAPLIESIILYDRYLYLLEKNCTTEVKAIFDPLLSARNQILISMK